MSYFVSQDKERSNLLEGITIILLSFVHIGTDNNLTIELVFREQIKSTFP